MTSSSPSIAPIHLAPLHPDEYAHNRTPSGLSHKDSFLSTFPGEQIEPATRPRQKRSLLPQWSWSWDKAETVLWAAVPLVFYLVAIALLLAVMLSSGSEMAFMTVREKRGTGRLEYFVLNSCATAPGTTDRNCTGRSLFVDFVPSLVQIGSALPGFSSLKLPFYSFQTPSIFLASLSIVITSFFLYLPLWTLVYFPHAPLPSRLVRWIRYHSRPLFYFAGIVSFLGFVFTLSIGLGYKLYFLGYIDDFENWYKFGIYRLGRKEIEWVAEIGRGFDAVWTASVCMAMTVVSINISLHNGLDERVEWPKDQKEMNTFGAF
ncbi:uncharacterized protein JCM6883_005148 [Sporobolomyces salmoneus]|uniref:uncharacterized protein n=1 Tax=Sporobolomyces salmoneus TaxID=183962 RepID=UPI00317C625D